MPLARTRSRGFALLIVITLLAFVIVLLVGLSVYTRVETAVAGNTQRQEQARQNALLGLNVAVGQLQKYAGPDQRVTAAADAFGGHTGTSHYTGVWSSDPNDPTATGNTPLTWLVSGNEPLQADGTPANPLAVDPISTVTTANGVALVSTNTTRTSNDVLARLMPITASGVPGTTATANTTVGRYAWWVGDQGVKAPVAVPDTSSSVSYAPYDSADLRTRLRQQISLGAGAADMSANPVFEPRDGNNSALVSNNKVTAASQIAFLKNSSGAAIGLTPLKTNFFAWSPNNYSVLANTKLGGLRQDLSLQPNLLGDAFSKWADYTDTTYMEDIGNPATPAPAPAYSSDPLRRRYFMRAAQDPAGATGAVGPVLSYFLLSFNIRTQAGSPTVSPLEARARWMFTLWNPYTAALVPENLRMEITGLPRVRVDDETAGTNPANFSLQSVFGAPTDVINISLPWDSTTSTAADHQSWLPGRVYTWTALQDTGNTGSAPAAGYASKFDSRNLSADAGQGVQQPASPVLVDGSHTSHIDGAGATLQIKLFAVRAGGDVLVGTFTSPVFNSFNGALPQPLDNGNYQFSYVFRLAESLDGSAWLTTAGVDPHSGVLGSEAFVATPLGPSPDLYVPNYATIDNPDRLLDRNGDSYDQDIPVFELPRAPILSLGELQHLQLLNQRPFAIGNSWGAAAQLNSVNVGELFDRYFFSGLVPSVTPTVVSGALLLPNPTLKPMARNPATGAALTAADLQGAPNAQSSKFLLQSAAFNLNSVSVPAWTAVLRSVRFPAPQSFSYANESFSTGTSSGDSNKLTVQSTDAQFFRFAQSAQETYEADDPASTTDASGTATTSTYAASTDAPPASPNPTSTANTHLFRRGMKTLTAAQVTALATNIANAVKAHQAASGPFRSLEEFLAPISGGPSLIEQAIVDADAGGAQINTDANGPIEFSSQYLTQADIMTALAPVLFPRSDTFIVRAYGEAVNPATGATEGKAWCEATVQRVPDYFDPADPAETAPADFGNVVDPTDPNSQPSAAHQLNKLYGRRFKIVAFRWLTRADI